MKIAAAIKHLLRNFGIDIREYVTSRSDAARLLKLFKHYRIDAVLDVGANNGQYADYLRGVGYNGKIVCFEPLEAPRLLLEKMALRDPAIIVAPRMALGEREGEITINISGNSLSSSVLPMLEDHKRISPGSAYVSAEVVKLGRLDSVDLSCVAGSTEIFLKIDAQGYEPKILEGAHGIFKRIRGIQLEMSLVQLYDGELLYREMISMLESLGYALHDINPSFADNESGRTYQVDGIFFRL